MLSHMRGHLADMEALMALCDRLGVTVIEDCAHTMGAAWNGKASGTFGAVGCFSMQTYKHINSGEGGLIVTDDAELAARMILLSGSYMLYERHTARPDLDVFERVKLETPNVSGRMDHLRAAILRPQLADLPRQVQRWMERYVALETGLGQTPGVRIAPRPQAETYVGSSFQFTLPGATADQIVALTKRCAARGVELKWFGAADPVAFTSRHSHWTYVPQQDLPNTDRILAGLLDMRVPLTFSVEDCALIARIIDDEARSTLPLAAE
jgi:dTDP-4-amino-4,6-dideoxygalactose transaminase